MAQQERRGEPETTGRVRGGGGFLPDIRGPSTQRAAAAAAQRRYARSPRHVEQQFQRGEQTPPQQQQPRQVIRQEPRGNRRQPRHPAKASDRRSRKDIEPARRAPQQERRRHPAAGQRGTVVVRVRKPKPFCNYRKHNRRLQRSVKSGAYANDRGLFPNAFPAAGGLIGKEPYISADERRRRDERASVAKFVGGAFVVCDHKAAVSRREEKLRGQMQDAGPYRENPQFREAHREKWIGGAFRGF